MASYQHRRSQRHISGAAYPPSTDYHRRSRTLQDITRERERVHNVDPILIEEMSQNVKYHSERAIKETLAERERRRIADENRMLKAASSEYYYRSPRRTGLLVDPEEEDIIRGVSEELRKPPPACVCYCSIM